MALSDYFSKSKTRELTEQEEFERVRREIANLNTRLSAVGEQPKKSPTSSPLLTVLESLVRPGYGIMNAAREFSNPDYGATPGVRDVPQAFARGFRLEERSTGKDVLTDLGVSDEPFADFNVGKVNLKPNLAGLLGFGLDVLNPLDPLNWVTMGVGKAGIKGAQQLVKGRKLLETSFGKDVTEELIEKLGEDWVSRVSEDTVGGLVKKLSDRADKLGIQEGINAHTISELMLKGIETQGLKADSRVRPKLQNAIKVNLQAPIVNKPVAQFDLPGSRPLLNVLGALGEKTSKSPVGQAMGQAFSTKFTPSTVPASVWTRFIRQGARVKDESPDKLSELIDNLRAGGPSTAPTTNLGTQIFMGLEPPDISKVNKIEPGFPDMAKPKGGFWTSSKMEGENVSDWARWLKSEYSSDLPPGTEIPKNFKLDDLTPYELHPAVDARILELGSKSSVDEFLEKYGHREGDNLNIDWDRVAQDYDGIHFSRDPGVMGTESPFYGVDSESTLWLNPEKILGEPPGKGWDILSQTRKGVHFSRDPRLGGTDYPFPQADSGASLGSGKLSEEPPISGTKALDDLETTSGEEAYKELKGGLYRMMEKARIQEQQFEREVADVFEGLNAKERKEVMKGVLYPDYEISDKLAPAVNAFKQWRQQVVDEYKSLGVTFTPIEEYVPFVVAGKPLSKDEAALLKGIFGTGVRQLQQGDIVDLLAKADPHLIERSTDVIDPAKINKILGREWLTEDAAVAMARRGVRAVRGEEASIFLHGMMEKWGLTIEDITQLQHLPDGYVMVKPRVESTGRINLDATKVEKGEKAFALPQEFVKAYNEYTDLMFNPESRTKLGQFFDQATRAYKTMAYMWNPGHIPRDLMSNLYNLWLMDVRSPAPYLKAAQIMRHAMMKNVDEVPLKIGEWEGTMKQFYNMVEQLGVIDSGAVLAEFMQAGSDWSFRMGGKYTDVMRKMTRVNDNWARMAGMIDRISKGYSPEEAAGQVKKYLFDYFELTPFEKRVMKRVVPFYTWIRKNLPLQVEMLFSKPGKYATTYKVMEGIGDIPEEGEVPDFIRDAGGVLLPGKEKGSYVIPNLSYADLGKVPLSLEQLREYMAMVNPIFRAPVEMMSNVSLFSGQPLENYRGEYRNIPFGELLKSLGAVEEPPKIPTRTLGYLLDQIPPLRTLSTISNPEHPRQMARLISFLGGPQIYPEDWALEAASYETRDELRSLIRSLQDRGTYVPTIDELTPNKAKKKKKGKITSLSDIF